MCRQEEQLGVKGYGSSKFPLNRRRPSRWSINFLWISSVGALTVFPCGAFAVYVCGRRFILLLAVRVCSSNSLLCRVWCFFFLFSFLRVELLLSLYLVFFSSGFLVVEDQSFEIRCYLIILFIYLFIFLSFVFLSFFVLVWRRVKFLWNLGMEWRYRCAMRWRRCFRISAACFAMCRGSQS